MTTRKLQKTGGASLSLVIPKKWAAQQNLNDKSELIIDSSDPKVLKLYPAPLVFTPTFFELDATNLTSDQLIREIIASYLSGADQVRLENLTLNPKQQLQIRNLCSSLIGFEIVEETAQHLILQNVFDSSKFPISANIEKMFVMIAGMFADAMLAINENDLTLSQNVINREKEIDKFHLAVTRQFYINLKNVVGENIGGHSTLDLHYFSLISRQLERIGDHLEKICHVIDKEFLPKAALKQLQPQMETIKSLIDLAKTMTINLDAKIAHQILDKSHLTMKKIAQIRDKHQSNSPISPTLCDSLDRICGYLTNMAEATLDQRLV